MKDKLRDDKLAKFAAGKKTVRVGRESELAQ
jgi:hypothetical protein